MSSPSSLPRVAAALLCAAAVFSCKVDIQHGLDEPEANQILVTLETAGVPSAKEREEGRPPTWKIRVPSSEAARAWQLLRQHELPRSRTKGFELFGKAGLIPSQTEERALFQQAISGEVTRMLQAYPGVVDARVLISMPKDRAVGVQGTAPRATASVLVKHEAQGDVPFKTADVQSLVAGASPGLDAKDVVVIAMPVRPIKAGSGDMASLGPFVVSSGSQTGLQLALLVGLGAIIVLCGAVVFGVMTLRRLRGRLRELESARAGGE